jgi:hypothetical protein
MAAGEDGGTPAIGDRERQPILFLLESGAGRGYGLELQARSLARRWPIAMLLALATRRAQHLVSTESERSMQDVEELGAEIFEPACNADHSASVQPLFEQCELTAWLLGSTIG